jgi:tRNA-splicing ligase RtcB
MNKIKNNILSWCNEPEQGAIDQAINISKHPWLVGNVCLMPDTHQGYGMPIGGVVALDKAICPNMVGVDIGCGMLAARTNLTDIDTENLKTILDKIREKVPVGFKHHETAQSSDLFKSTMWDTTLVCKEEFESAQRQLGTLGGGNHFIEIQRGDDGYIWIMIHSGSRNLGKKVADYYNKVAVRLCDVWKHEKIIKDELAVLPMQTKEFNDYYNEMQLCLMFAHENRQLMLQRIKESFEEILPFVNWFDEINIHHNYASLENHFGKNVWVHRKGATAAREGQLGIIPGSQGTCSYIVRGLGNKASMMSCSHGAGRKMSRKAARENLDLKAEQERLDKQGILHAIRNIEDLDEASSAYKDIDVVMEEQKDLVEICVKLTPLAVIKG